MQEIIGHELLDPARPLLSHHVARALNVPLRTIRHWAKTQRLPACKDPHRPKIWLYPRQAIIASQGGDHAQ